MRFSSVESSSSPLDRVQRLSKVVAARVDEGVTGGGQGKSHVVTAQLDKQPRQPRPKPFTLLSEVKSQPVEWLWSGRIPLGELTLFDGDPATNKSSVALDIAARVSTGRPMPDGGDGCPGTVLLLSAEDSIEKTVRPRLLAAGGDPERVAVIRNVLSIPEDLAVIGESIYQLHAKLLVLDPLTAFLGRNANMDQSVRLALAPLVQMADRHALAVVAIRHLNKTVGQRSLYRGLGSIGVAAVARSRFLLGNSPEDPNLRVMCHQKCALLPRAPSLLYEPLGDGILHVEWRGECEFTAADILTPPKDRQRARNDATRLILETLSKGPVEQQVIQAEATAAGIAWRTMERAKCDLRVVSRRKGFGPGSTVVWDLPPEDNAHIPPTKKLAVYGHDTPSNGGVS